VVEGLAGEKAPLDCGIKRSATPLSNAGAIP
jgi:hypothetical protein